MAFLYIIFVEVYIFIALPKITAEKIEILAFDVYFLAFWSKVTFDLESISQISCGQFGIY